MLILNNQDAAALLPMKTAIEQLERAYIDMIEGRAVCRVSTGLKMATDNPERYRQFREWEDEEIKRQKKIFVDAAKLGANVLSKAITKR